MWAISLIVAAFFLGLAVMMIGGWLGAGAVVGVPLAIVVVVALGVADFQRRRRQARTLGAQRERARAQKTEFSDRDRETLVSERPSERTRRGAGDETRVER